MTTGSCFQNVEAVPLMFDNLREALRTCPMKWGLRRVQALARPIWATRALLERPGELAR